MSLVVISSQNLSPGIRGALTKWMLEIGAGTFVGVLPERMVQELWKSVDEWCLGADPDLNAHATLVRPAATEQGFVFATSGEGRYLPTEYAGLWLVQREIRAVAADSLGHDEALDGSSESVDFGSDTAVPW